MNIILSSVLPAAAGVICVVDDDPSMLKALNRLLSSVGLQAKLFSEPLAFLTYVICNTVALAVLDIFMSGMSGLEVQKELQAVSPKGRVVISTANDHDSVQNAAIQAGLSPISFNVLMTRPFSLPSSHGLGELNVLTAPF